jgi:hypothetical protein
MLDKEIKLQAEKDPYDLKFITEVFKKNDYGMDR